MVDYSKWDKFDVSDSDDEASSGPVQVTRLDKSSSGGRVTIGREGYTIEEDDMTTKVVVAEKAAALVPQITEKGKTDAWFHGEYEGHLYHWQQDRYEVIIFAQVPWVSAYSKKDIIVKFEEGDRSIALAPKKWKTESDTFVAALQYDIVLAGDPSNPWDDVIEWNLESWNNEPAVKFVFRKKSPLANATFWWRKVFQGTPEIDVTNLPGRTFDRRTQDNFQLAQEEFRRKVAADELGVYLGLPNDDEKADEAEK